MKISRRKVNDRVGSMTVINVKLAKHLGEETVLTMKCDCGKIFDISARKLGRRKSCGCLKKDANTRRFWKHGLRGSRIYNIWYKMIARCEKPETAFYERYGGRGIQVCKEWHDISSFYAWSITNGYDDSKTIDRINNDGNYEPNNCRWTDPLTQANNTSANVRISIDGVIKNICEWADELGIKRATVCQRVARGWNLRDALFKPLRGCKDSSNKEWPRVELIFTREG